MTRRPPAALPQAAGHDACALIAHVAATAGRAGLERVLAGLRAMEHRCGRVAGEVDGVGVHVDLPRSLWADRVGDAAHAGDFAVAHLFLPGAVSLLDAWRPAGLERLATVVGAVRSNVLGPIAARREPVFVQLALRVTGADPELALFEAQLALEQAGIHVASLSRHHVVYKVHGGVATLSGYYPDLADPRLISAITLGHSRFSTNTLPAFERVQPAALLGHNGEINTIDRLRREAALLGIPQVPGGSDSQDLDRVLHAFVTRFGLTLAEAMATLFPPVPSEVAAMNPGARAAFGFLRRFWGPFAQGPAAIVCRWRDDVHFATDALGLRPLWVLDTAEGWYVTSERSALPFEINSSEPRPLAPGEALGMRVERGVAVCLQDQASLRNLVETRFAQPAGRAAPVPAATAARRPRPAPAERLLAAFGFRQEDIQGAQAMAAAGADPIGSLGFDGPLAALSPEGRQLADYCKESVAVVTNPAMDREREREHFSTGPVRRGLRRTGVPFHNREARSRARAVRHVARPARGPGRRSRPGGPRRGRAARLR